MLLLLSRRQRERAEVDRMPALFLRSKLNCVGSGGLDLNLAELAGSEIIVSVCRLD